MRLASHVKMGFYPTPPMTLQRIANFLLPDRKGVVRVLDPCAGLGEAIKHVGDHLREQGASIDTYGVELSDVRGTAFHSNVDHPIHGDWFSVSMTPKSISLLYLNPPYTEDRVEGEEKTVRLEYTFLQKTIQKLVYDGLLVYIVPLHIIQKKQYINYIANNFRDIRVYRLPDGEYERFKQIVLFGRRRPVNDGEAREELPDYTESNIPPLPEFADHEYVIPALRQQKIMFRIDVLDDDELVQRVRTNGAHTTRNWAQLTQIKDHSEFQPVIKLKVGHIAGLITSGQMGVVKLPDRLAVGRTYKKIDRSIKSENEDGDKVVVERDRFVTAVTTLQEDGTLETIATPAEMDRFLDEYGEDIGALVAEKYAPLYQGADEEEWRKLARLMKRKQLKGRKDSGLFLAQKHVAAAMKRAIDRDKWVTLVGEMGTGKTATSIATAELHDKWPVIVMAPTHLVDKWAAEVSLVVPDAKGFVINDLADLNKFRREWQPGKKWFAVLSKEKAKLGPGWTHAYITKKKKVAHKLPNGDVVHQMIEIVACPKCGRIQVDKEGGPITPGNIGRKRLYCTRKVTRWKGDPHDNTQGEKVKKNKRGHDLYCNEPLWRIENPDASSYIGEREGTGGVRRWPLADYIHDQMKGFFKLFIADECHEYKAKDSAQAMAYHALRDACGAVINLTGTIFNGKSTSLFWMLYRNDREVRRIYDFNSESAWAGLYGRLERTQTTSEKKEDAEYSLKGKNKNKAKEIPGISPAIYSRLLPNTIFLKKSDLGWKLPPYSEQVIRLDMGTEQKAQYDWMYNVLFNTVMSGLSSRDSERMKEANRLLSVWLQRSMNRPDAAFRREMVMWKAIEGAPAKPEHYRPFLVDHMPDFGRDADHPFLLEGKDTDLPDTHLYHDPEMTQWDQYTDEMDGMTPMFLDRAVDENALLPKEAHMVNLIRDEVHQGNKFLLYVNQTGERDIQERLEAILESAGVRAQVLPKHIEARGRMAWIEKNHQNIEVLICNPESVKTGLDLVMFNRIYYYELPIKLDTLQQSMHRIYRIGQTRETKVYFAVYKDSMEEHFLALIREKIKAAALLYGDSSASAIADEDGGDDLMKELANRLMSGDKLEDNFNDIMAPALALEAEDDDWEEIEAPEVLEITCAPAPKEEKPHQETSYIRQSWMEFIEQEMQNKSKPKVKGNQKVHETQMLLF